MGNDTQSQSQVKSQNRTPQPSPSKTPAPKPAVRLNGPRKAVPQQFAVQFTENAEGMFPVTNGYITGSFVECEGELTVGHGPGKTVIKAADTYLAQSTMPLSKELQEALQASSEDPSRGSNPFYYVIFEGVLEIQAGITLAVWARDYQVLEVQVGTSLGSRVQDEAVALASQNSTVVHETKRQEYLAKSAPSSFQDILGQALRKGLNL
jgi:hypothetical protein